MQRFGFRAFEAVIAVLVGVIGACYIIELTFAHADYGAVFKHAVEPQFGSGEALLLAVGIIGATVMPHVIYLHSALTQDRLVPETDEDARTLLRGAYTLRITAVDLGGGELALTDDERVDVVIAMTIAGVINVSMLVMAASTFYRTGLFHIASLDTAHKTLQPILGSASGAIFALALIASGLSSSAVGTLSGQVVMQGFIRRQIPVTVRRLVTMIPSFGIPFALIPLVIFTARSDIMGPLVNRRITTVAATGVTALIVALNVFLLLQTFGAV